MALIRLDPTFRRLIEEDLSRLFEISRNLVSQNAPLIDRIARRLVERRVLGGDEVRAIIAEGPGHVAKSHLSADMGGFHG